MDMIVKLFSTGLLVWFALLAALIAVRILRRDIDVAGFLAQSAAPDSPVLPERVVTVAMFPTIVIGYALLALHADVSGATPHLPDIPDSVVVLLAASNSLYLAGKIARN
jgi:hypothetical protein